MRIGSWNENIDLGSIQSAVRHEARTRTFATLLRPRRRLCLVDFPLELSARPIHPVLFRGNRRAQAPTPTLPHDEGGLSGVFVGLGMPPLPETKTLRDTPTKSPTNTGLSSAQC